MTQPPRTITVTTRRRAWLTRLTVTHPDHPPQAPTGPHHYDADRAREPLTRTAMSASGVCLLCQLRHAFP